MYQNKEEAVNDNKLVIDDNKQYLAVYEDNVDDKDYYLEVCKGNELDEVIKEDLEEQGEDEATYTLFELVPVGKAVIKTSPTITFIKG